MLKFVVFLKNIFYILDNSFLHLRIIIVQYMSENINHNSGYMISKTHKINKFYILYQVLLFKQIIVSVISLRFGAHKYIEHWLVL